MSDVGIGQAPPSSPAPSAPAAPAGEVVINPSPTNAPTPVGPQAPGKPVGDIEGGKGRPESRRESIQKAFDRAREGDAGDKPKVAKSPSDRTERKPSPEKDDAQGKLDLRKPPSAQTERYREQGRFAKQPAAPGQEGQVLPGQPGQQQAAQSKPAAPLPENAPYREPPPRFSERGKQEWATAPESVRGEVYRMAKEFDGAYRQYRSDNETMNSIRHFHEMATQHGTTLDRALSNYVSMEQKLRTDVVGGLDIIVNNLNLRTSDGKKLNLRDVCYHVLNQSPDQHRLVQQQNAQQSQSHQIGQLHQMVASLAQNVQQMHTEKVFGQTRSSVDQFADDGRHPRFDELGELIEQELRFGFSLEEAYQRAERLSPANPARAAQTRTTPAQTRSDKSIHGAPDSGPSDGPPAKRRDGKAVGRREAIHNAIRRVNGGV
jgi:hypothetical protein